VNRKTGLIEKRSGGRRREWKAYSFTLNFTKGIFQYTRPGPFGKTPQIRLDEITQIKQLKSGGDRFPFDVYFDGRNSPWELNVYSEDERRQWMEALSTKGDGREDIQGRVQKRKAYVHLPPKEEDVYDFIDPPTPPLSPYETLPPLPPLPPDVASHRLSGSEDVYEYIDLSVTDLSVPPPLPPLPLIVSPYLPPPPTPKVVPPLLQPPPDAAPSPPPPLPAPLLPPPGVALSSSTSSPFPPADVADVAPALPYPPYDEAASTLLPDVAPSRTNDDEHFYVKIIEALKENFNPVQLGAFAQKLASTQGKHLQNISTTTSVPQEDTKLQELQEETPTAGSETEPEELYEKFIPLDHQEEEELDGVYEEPDKPSTYIAPVAMRTERIGSCAGLQMLQEKAFSIRLSSLSHMEKIGEGQYGEVYQAQMDNTTVAIKVIKRFSSVKVMSQFEREMTTMTQVSHHNLVKLHGIMREGPFSPALVMEYLPYGNLKTFLMREGQPNEFLMKCMTDVAMGMHYLSERGLIHRDLAARNVLVDENKTCKVSDFGLLREVPRDKRVYVSQNDGQSPLRWMAPESITDNIFSPATDVWSYGILQWEMFFPHRNPYHDMDNTQMVAKVSCGYRMAIPRGCPPLVVKIMRACWEHDPKERPNFLLISNLLTRREQIAKEI
jgi:tRNA A-37 threonylcarbamoyl transferase component Bud32